MFYVQGMEWLDVSVVNAYLYNTINDVLCSGNRVTGCVRGECVSLQHNQCPDNKACYDSTCIGIITIKL